MPFAAGELVLGRYRVVEALAPWGELLRWSARDEALGVEVELCAPTAGAALRPGAAEAWAAAWAPGRPEIDGLVAPLDVGFERGRPVGVRPAGLRPAAPRLPPEALPGLVDSLGPAFSAAGPRWASRYLAVDAAGRAAVAPDGLPPADGDPAGPAAELWRRLTGRAPDGRPAAQLAPGLSPAQTDMLDAILVALPSVAQAARPLLPAAEGAALAHPAGPAPAPRARPRLGGGAYYVVADGDLARPALGRAAALSGLSAPALVAAAGGGGPLPLGRAADPAEAAARAAALRAALPVRVVEAAAPTSALIGATILGLVGLISLAAGAVSALFTLGLGALIALAFGALTLVGAGLLGQRALAGRAAAAALEARWRALVEAPGPDAVEGALAGARAAVLQSGLPEVAVIDLLDGIDDLEADLPAGVGAAEVEALLAPVLAAATAPAGAPPAPAPGAAAALAQRARAAQGLRSG
ncbi:MAG: hypothetical protein JNM72_06565 [Deltaproteobacteria bacterium]|nr:hypothetical protein [Deltaproteobacteria bacterium]